MNKLLLFLLLVFFGVPCHCIELPSESPITPEVWISIAVCLDSNTDFANNLKGRFPYRLASMYSSYLWRKLIGYRVIVGLVTDHPHHADSMARALHAVDINSYIVRSWPGYSCATTSQLVRMFAYKHAHLIKPYDIVVTADADAFVVSPLIKNPLKIRNKIVWLWQHKYAEEKGQTFPMSFIGARSAQWRTLLDPFGLINHVDIMKRWETVLNITDRWGIDQSICTRALLESNLCTTINSAIYDTVGLPLWTGPVSQLCYYGDFLRGGTWLHFTPQVIQGELKGEFMRIVRAHKLPINDSTFYWDIDDGITGKHQHR